MCKIAGKNYDSRKHMDALFEVTAEIDALTELLTTDAEDSKDVQQAVRMGNQPGVGNSSDGQYYVSRSSVPIS